MIALNQISQKEAEDKKKAKRFAFWFSSILTIAFVFPFLTQTEREAPKYEQVITIEFKEEFKSAAAKSSTKKAVPAAAKPVVKPKPVEKPKPKPVVKTAPHKPVIKTPEPKAPVIKEAPVVKKDPVIIPPKVEPTPAPVEEEIVEVVEEVAEETTTETTAATGKPSDKGEGESGSSDKGDAPTDGKADKGDSGLDFSGEGLFSRRVVYRADIRQLTKEEGKIVINLCVNQQGRVIYTEFNKGESTIETMTLIREAMDATKNYRFEKDYTAARKQCGKLSFVFEIEEE